MKRLYIAVVALYCFHLLAAELVKPEGSIILTISGDIANTQDGNKAEFDLDQLKQLESKTYTMKTPWDDQVHRYHGPLLSAVLESVGANASKLRLTALNDYSIFITNKYISKYQPILAWKKDDKAMSVRDKGPLWLLIPGEYLNSKNEVDHETNMIWQLHEIEVTDG